MATETDIPDRLANDIAQQANKLITSELDALPQNSAAIYVRIMVTVLLVKHIFRAMPKQMHPVLITLLDAEISATLRKL